MKYVLILAGGLGRRMGATEVPKQFITIDDVPIIIYTIRQFYSLPQFDKIIAVVPEAYQKYIDDLLKKNNLSNVITVIGGSTRYESILRGCQHIKDNLDNDDKTIVLSHDAVRPFVSKQIIEEHLRVIEYSDRYCAVDTIIPMANETIIKLIAGRVEDIPNTDCYFRSQTPQTFKLHEYMDLCSNLKPEEKEKLKDVCKIYYLKNKTIGYVVGDEINIPINTPYDLEYARSLVKKLKR